MKFFLTLSFSFFLFVTVSAQRLKLALNLTTGNTYYLKGNTNTIILQTINGQENEISTTTSYQMAFKVTAVKDTLYSMEVHYEYIHLKILIGAQTIEMDSKKNDRGDMASTIIASLMNKPFIIQMAKNGKIKSINGIEKMINDVFDNFPQFEQGRKDQVRAQLLQSFGGSALKGNLEMSTAVFPEIPVLKTDNWTVNTRLESTVKMNVKTVYHLADLKDGCYQIHGVGSLNTDKNLKPGIVKGMPVKYNLGGTAVSDLKIDKTTGWMSEVKLSEEMKGNLEILDNPKVPGGLNIPITIITKAVTSDK